MCTMHSCLSSLAVSLPLLLGTSSYRKSLCYVFLQIIEIPLLHANFNVSIR